MKTMKNDFRINENNRFGNRRFTRGNSEFYKEDKGMKNIRNDFNGNENNRFENRRFPHGSPEWNRFGRPHFHGYRMRSFHGRPFNRNFRACKPAGFEC